MNQPHIALQPPAYRSYAGDGEITGEMVAYYVERARTSPGVVATGAASAVSRANALSTTVSGATFCLEFVVATAAILEGDVFKDKFSLDRLNGPPIQALMSNMRVRPDEEFGRKSA